GSDPADAAVGLRDGGPGGRLHTKTDGFAPLVVLVVVVAARVEAQIAAQGAHVAQLGGRDLSGRAPEGPVARAQGGVGHQGGQRQVGGGGGGGGGGAGGWGRGGRLITNGGVCWRLFMLGTRSVPPASSIAPGPASRRAAAASASERAAW